MNNAVFCNTMENVRNRVDVWMATSKKQINNLARKTNYQSFNIISENLTSVRMRRSIVMLDKPIYLGAAILDLSKIVMYDFWYNYIKSTWGDRVKLIMTDTDSLFVYTLRRTTWMWTSLKEVIISSTSITATTRRTIRCTSATTKWSSAL